MHFKLELILRLSLGEEFEIRLEDSKLPGLVLRFSPVSDKTDKGYGGDLCAVLSEITPSAKVAELLQNPSTPLPKGLQDFADDLEGRLYEAATKAVKLLRWFRSDCEADSPIGVVKQLTYSPDAVHWRKLPRTINLNIAFGIAQLKMSDKVAASVGELWREGAEEPLGQELFREAAHHERNNPRSCLVLAVAAAEVGFKELIGHLVPDAKWLADNVPSPPLEKMLTEYLPLLPTKLRLDGTIPKVPEKLIGTIKKAVLLRNQVVHGKSPRISSGTLHEILEAIHDCLYLFDCYNGYCWAWTLISVETQRLMVQESSGEVDASGLKNSKRAK